MKLKKSLDFFYSESGSIGLDITRTEVGHVKYEANDFSVSRVAHRTGSRIHPSSINAKTRYGYHPWTRK